VGLGPVIGLLLLRLGIDWKLYFATTHFVKVDLERLKKDVISVLNDTFFDKLGDVVSSVEASANSKPAAAGFLQSVLRRTKRLAALHTQ
jgi:hypothetical protein